MKFKINDREWIIKEVEQDEFRNIHNDFSGDGCYYGTTFPSIQEIWLYKDITKEMKKKTLYHELMHCYIYCYLCDGLQFDEEGICNISAKSHNMIHKIVKEYFNE